MKSKFIAMACCAATLVSCSNTTLTISGEIENMPDSILYVSILDENFELSSIDTLKVENNKFFFKGYNAEQEECVILHTKDKIIGQLFVGNDNVEIKGDAQNPQDIDIEGSALTDTLISFLENIPEQENLASLAQQLRTVGNDIDRRNSIMEEINAARAEQMAYIKHFINGKSSSPIGPFIFINNMTIYSFEEADSMTATFLKAMPNHKYAIKLRAEFEKTRPLYEAQQRVAIGQMAPDFTLMDINGNVVSLSDTRGKIVLLDFWASWCKPCRQNNKTLVEAYDKFSDSFLEIVSVSIDDDQEKWKSAVAEDKLPGIQLIDNETDSIAKLYCIQSIPCCYLIDTDGKITSKDVGGKNIFADIEALAKKYKTDK